LTQASRLKKDTIPGDLQQIVQIWEDLCDDLAIDLIFALSGKVFGLTGPNLTTRADLPVAYSSQIGMLDIVKYLNNKTVQVSPEIGHSTEEVNCVPHYDPGLLSFSFLSTHKGLQLLDPVTNTWFAGPVNTHPGQENLAVIWLGEAAVKATEGKLKAGVHRVVYSDTPTPRITAWYEICTVTQCNNELNGYSGLEEGNVQPPNILDAKPLKLNPKYGMREIQRYYGLSESKVMFRDEDLRAYYSDEKPKKIVGKKKQSKN